MWRGWYFNRQVLVLGSPFPTFLGPKKSKNFIMGAFGFLAIFQRPTSGHGRNWWGLLCCTDACRQRWSKDYTWCLHEVSAKNGNFGQSFRQDYQLAAHSYAVRRDRGKWKQQGWPWYYVHTTYFWGDGGLMQNNRPICTWWRGVGHFLVVLQQCTNN